MVKEYKMFQAWKRTEEDENLQLEALFDALYVAGMLRLNVKQLLPLSEKYTCLFIKYYLIYCR